jgi:hypothetical protein
MARASVFLIVVMVVVVVAVAVTAATIMTCLKITGEIIVT